MTTATRSRRKMAPKADMPEVKMTELLEQALNAPGALAGTYSRFYEYSFMNLIWIMVQGVDSPCGTYRFWLNKFQRQVQKGQKAHTVLHPIFVTKRKDGVPVLDKNGRKVMILIGFQPKATVFQYSQTEGPDVEWPELPTWDMTMALNTLDVTKVRFKNTNGNVQGYSVDRTFAINPTAVYPVKTTFHELAHIVLGHTTDDGLVEYQGHRGVEEFQAEAVAYLVAHELELDDWNASESRAYIQTWLGGNGDDVITDNHVKAVFGAVNKILKAGRPARVTEES